MGDLSSSICANIRKPIENPLNPWKIEGKATFLFPVAIVAQVCLFFSLFRKVLLDKMARRFYQQSAAALGSQPLPTICPMFLWAGHWHSDQNWPIGARTPVLPPARTVGGAPAVGDNGQYDRFPNKRARVVSRQQVGYLCRVANQ